jgi:hypothetical protein
VNFLVTITMDKHEIRHPRNVARALERLAQDLDKQFGIDDEPEEVEGVIKDVSGSVVGRWELRP